MLREQVGLTEAELTKSKERCDVLRQLRDNLDAFRAFTKEREAIQTYYSRGGSCYANCLRYNVSFSSSTGI